MNEEYLGDKVIAIILISFLVFSTIVIGFAIYATYQVEIATIVQEGQQNVPSN